ncbi:hypothetical protein XC_0099 [Xanthomonas campestris pv. campestris str. 8004]|uniref:Uncharacterized protein n=1 Tax=Xanthomonas campestris pv. campestris (strain 8004) TaxID=314565 RepID=A0A0H2X2F9_XANC8|nr:hypothetical protein XC_0099 [Xanthomonas campestris pv. campestris str. 8004]
MRDEEPGALTPPGFFVGDARCDRRAKMQSAQPVIEI